MAESVGPWAHGRCGRAGRSIGSCRGRYRVLAYSTGSCNSTGAVTPSTITWATAGGSSHMKLLLMSEEEIPTSETSGTFRAFEWLLLRVRTLMTLQVLQTSKRPGTCCTDVRPRLIGLGWWWRRKLSSISFLWRPSRWGCSSCEHIISLQEGHSRHHESNVVPVDDDACSTIVSFVSLIMAGQRVT